MSNPKTAASSAPEPEVRHGWVRKNELDAYLDRQLPMPTQVVSNEEFYPLPQTVEQRCVERRLLEIAERNARKLGVDRRRFLRTSCGMAASFAALNAVFGEFFAVDAGEMIEAAPDPDGAGPAAVPDKKTKYFIFDIQTHHVDAGTHFPFISTLLEFRRIGGDWNPELKKHEPKIDDLYLANYIKEVFLDSETDMAVISGFPSPTDETNFLPPDQMVKTRSLINQAANSRRMVSHGLITPDLGTRNLESMQEQAEKLKIDAWKGYTGVPLGPSKVGWWLDDEKEAYPTFELSRKLGIKNICIHKGLPLEGFNVEHCNPKDVVKASKDFPDLNFLLYHSGFKALQDALPAAESGFHKTAYVPWVSDLCVYRKRNPHMTNVYMELGSTFGQMVITHPLLCTYVLGMIIEAFGADHVLWGTDSIWWGSPQWQIEAMRRLQMPESLIKKFGYKPLTTDVKRQIFGLNAARLYGVDPTAKRYPIPGDYVDQLKKLYRETGSQTPSNTQYGWVRA